jgi:DNA repair exonuclease SbcCD ATPase subunit
MQTELINLRAKLEQERGKLYQLQSDRDTTESKLNSNLELRIDIEEAQIIIQTVSQGTQNQITEYISDLVSSALEAVFDNPYRLSLEFVQKRGKTEAVLKFLRDGCEIDPIDASGGGVINIAALSLRIGLWSLLKETRNVILCDEPAHFLHDSEAQGRFAELLSSLSKELNLQIIMVTGEKESAEILSRADRIFHLELDGNGITQIGVEDNP